MLKGIEAQMMVTRTADLSREAGAMQRKNDLTRDYLVQHAQALSELEKQRVERTLNTQQIVIHPDKHGSNQQEYPEQGEQKDYEEEDALIELPSGNHNTIDIKI